ELTTPALLAVLTPVIIGFGVGYTALGAFLAAVILVGQLMANYLSNAGGAWDNAKKFIEDGHHGGKGSEAHVTAVSGDTVGDPFKDTAGPALNPLIKVMNLVSLLILPAIISLSDIGDNILDTTPKPAAYAIAVAALVVLLGAIAFSKRSGAGITDVVCSAGDGRTDVAEATTAQIGCRRPAGAPAARGAGPAGPAPRRARPGLAGAVAGRGGASTSPLHAPASPRRGPTGGAAPAARARCRPGGGRTWRCGPSSAPRPTG